MNLLNKLTIKNLKLNRKRTIVTIIGIILSVALITAVASMYFSAIASLIKFETAEKGNFHIAFFDVPVSELDSFKNNRKIETINLTQNIGYAKIDSQNEYKPYAFVKAFTKNSLENLSVKLVEGRLPENEDEIIIPTHLKTNGRLILKVGDTITLDIGRRIDVDGNELNQNNPLQIEHEDESTNKVIAREMLEDTSSKTYKIVGIIERPASNIEGYSAPGYTFITYSDEDKISNKSDIYVRYTKEGLKEIDKITANILGIDENLFEKVNNDYGNVTEEEWKEYNEQMQNAKYAVSTNSYLYMLETNPLKEGTIGGLGVVVGIVCAIIIVTSVFCIKNSFDISITEKIKQYGMLRSIGATKKQIRRNVFYEATMLGIIGVPAGIGVGFLASYILIIVSNYLLKGAFSENLRLYFKFSWIAVLIAVILGIITIYLSAHRSARRAGKVSPIDSIRNSSNIKIKTKELKTPKFIKKIFGIGGEISYKNLKRNKKKYRTTVISIIVSVSIFIALSAFMNMAFDTADNELERSEYNISLYISANENGYKDIIEITKLDNIEDVSLVRTSMLDIENAKLTDEYMEWIGVNDNSEEDSYYYYIDIIAVGEEQYKNYIATMGLNYNDIKDKAILIDYQKYYKYDESSNSTINKYMKQYNYTVGDEIIGQVNDKDWSFMIAVETDKYPFGLKYYESSTPKIIVSDELFDKVSLSKSYRILFKSNNADKLQEDIEELLKGKDYSLSNSDENFRTMNNLFTLIAIFLYGFIIVISLIGVTNIFNTITTNMELRKPEFAMLKSVGMTTSEFKRMIRLESLFMGVRALIFGVPIGIVLSYVIYHFLEGESGLPYKLPIVAIAIAIVAVFILITSLMRYSINKINKQNTIETIRNENI